MRIEPGSSRRASRPGAAQSVPAYRAWIEEIGLAVLALQRCLGLYAGILAGRARLDLPAFSAALRQSGLSILPAISLVSVLVGIILGHQTRSILAQVDLPSPILVSVAYAVVMEIVPILVGILVAGRAGVALAVRQATLAVSGEIDGLLVSGVDPIRLTTGPVLLAMLAMSFAFVVWGSLLTLAAAAAWLRAVGGVPIALFLEAFDRALAPGDLLEALIKPMIFSVLAALIATVNGTLAGRDPDGIARAATRTMIGAVSAILVVDVLIVVFMRS